MITFEIDRLKEVDDSLKHQLKKTGFNSIRDIVIRGPVEVAKHAGIKIEEAADVCSKASLMMEQLGAVPNSLSKTCKNNPTFKKEYLKTGSSALDSLFGGNGIETGAITEFYGHSGSGKSQISQTLCVTVQQLHPENKAIYIDTEGKFRPERIAQIAQEKHLDRTKILSNIKGARTLNSSRLETIIQEECSYQLAKEPNMKLLVVDSIASHYRAEYAGYSLLSQRQHQLLKLMHNLRNIAHAYNIAVVITNQIQADPNEWRSSSDKPVGGNVIAHSSTFRIRLRGSDPDNMSAKLMISPCYPQAEIGFAIDGCGIKDVSKL